MYSDSMHQLFNNKFSTNQCLTEHSKNCIIWSNTIIDHDLIGKRVMYILNRISSIHAILIMTDATHDNGNYDLNDKNHICFKLNNTRIGMYVSNTSSIIGCIVTNFGMSNVYNIDIYNKFVAEADKIIACHSIVDKINNCSQYIIVTIVITTDTTMYLIQTLLVELQIIWKIALLDNVCDTRQAAITIHILIMNFDPLLMAEVPKDAIIVGCLVEEIEGIIVIEL